MKLRRKRKWWDKKVTLLRYESTTIQHINLVALFFILIYGLSLISSSCPCIVSSLLNMEDLSVSRVSPPSPGTWSHFIEDNRYEYKVNYHITAKYCTLQITRIRLHTIHKIHIARQCPVSTKTLIQVLFYLARISLDHFIGNLLFWIYNQL